MIVLEDEVAEHQSTMFGENLKELRLPLMLKESSYNFGFNKHIPASFFKRFSRAFEELKQEGFLDKVHNKYDHIPSAYSKDIKPTK